jgi:lipoprotein signal peptidase
MKKISFSQMVFLFIVVILTGTYLLFPGGQKSEFFYLVFMTIVISGADGQFFDHLIKKIASKRKEKNPLIDQD